MKVVLALLVVSVARASDIDTSATCAAGDGACSTVEPDNKTLTKAPVMMQLAGEITKRAVPHKESEGLVEIGTAYAVNDVKKKTKDERAPVNDIKGKMNAKGKVPTMMMDTNGGGIEPVSLHSDEVIHYPTRRVAWADFGRDAEAEVKEMKDVFYVDSGSSGNHLFAYLSEGNWITQEANYEAKCVNTDFTNMGLAAMGLPRQECRPTFSYFDNDGKPRWVNDEEKDWAAYHLGTLEKDWWERYRKTIFEGLYDTWEQKIDDIAYALPPQFDLKCMRQFANIEKIPIVATAGMRLVSQDVNDVVWKNICGQEFEIEKNKCPSVKQSTLMKFASGDKCGTIPGTQEAFYEWGAHVSYQWGLEGTFTMGGASAQIAIPLVTKDDVKEFEILIKSVSDDPGFDCNKMRLPGTVTAKFPRGTRAPWFSGTKTHCADDEKTPCKDCLGDYISMKTVEEVRNEFPKTLKVPEMEGLGLVSFLGLAGKGLVAGGSNQIKVWAQENNCERDQQESFEACTEKLRTALQEDALWRHVTKHFSTHNLDVHGFSFDTPASNPNLALMGLRKIEIRELFDAVPDTEKKPEPDAAYTLRNNLDKFCSIDDFIKGGSGFAYKDSLSCIMAYWVSLYTTAFFAPSTNEFTANGLMGRLLTKGAEAKFRLAARPK